jgi:hypothetical protein
MASFGTEKTAFVKRAPRERSIANAWIRQTGSFATQECHVIEISGTGFRLQTVEADHIPNNFNLLFSKRGPGRRASVIWRRGTEVGAEFSIASTSPPRV